VPERRRPCRTCGRNRAERFFRSPRGRVCLDCQRKGRSRSTHARRVQRTYGLLPGQYEALLELQGGRCAICREWRSYRLNVDHDHAREKAALDAGYSPEAAASLSVRGLLCRRCNGRLLPGCRDDVFILEAAKQYLLNPPAEELAQLGSGVAC
jgi:hypothetical protein